MASPLKKHKVRTTYMFRNDPINQVCIYSEPVNETKKSNDSTSLVGQMYALCPADYQYSNKLASVASYQNAKSTLVDQSDIECDYCPSYEISFGETICSFGLPYNDHNYAVPNGLTPPNTPPHLKDGLSSFFKFDVADSEKPMEDPELAIISERTDQLLNSFVDHEDGVSRWERKLRALLKAQNLINGDSNDDANSTLTMEAEFAKVVEVPEELCVSPSQMNDNESDPDEFLFDDSGSQKGSKQPGSGHPNAISGDHARSSSNSSYSFQKFVQAADIMSRAQAAGCSKIAKKLPVNSTITCLCNHKHCDGGLIQCILCFNWQHFDCVYYGEKLSNPYTCHLCMMRSVDTSRANQIQNLKLSGRPLPSKLYYSNAAPPQLVVDPSVVFSPQKNTFSKGKCITEKIIESHSDLVKAIPSPPRSSKRKQDLSCQAYMEMEEYKKMEKTKKAAAPDDSSKDKSKESDQKKAPGGTNNKPRIKSSLKANNKRSNESSSTSHLNRSNVVSGSESLLPSGSPIKTECVNFDESSSHSSKLIDDNEDASVKDDDDLPASQAAPASARMATVVSAEQTPSDKAIIRYGVRKRQRRKRLPNEFPDQPPAAENSSTPQSMDFEQISENQSSELIQNIMIETCSSGKVFFYDNIPPFLMRSPLCRIVLFGPSERGLESSCTLAKGDYIAEFCGCVMLLSEYESFSDIYHEYNRYLLSVNFDNKDIVVDASKVGNETRFIRRSCKPNSIINTVLVGASLHFMIRASEVIMPGTELTLPFDVNYTMCRYNVECACSRSRCPVIRWNKKIESKRAVPTLDYSKYIQSQLRVLSQPMSQNQPYKPTASSRTNSGKNSKSCDLSQQYVVTNFTLDDVREPPLGMEEMAEQSGNEQEDSSGRMPFTPIIRTRRQKQKS